jgi:hypothetical protein
MRKMNLTQLKQNLPYCEMLTGEQCKFLKGGILQAQVEYSSSEDPPPGAGGGIYLSDSLYINSYGQMFEKIGGEWAISRTLDNVTVTATKTNYTSGYTSIVGGLTDPNTTWQGVSYNYYPVTGSGGSNGTDSTVYSESIFLSKLKSVIGGLGIPQGTMEQLFKLESSLENLGLVKVISKTGIGLAIADGTFSILEAVEAYQNGDPNADDLAKKAGIDVGVGIFCGLTGWVGFAIGTAYYILDENGNIDKWVQSSEGDLP